MIIRRDGQVVGMLDDQSLRLTDVTSADLQILIDRLRKDGMYVMAADSDEDLPKGQASGDAAHDIPFTADNLHHIEMQLLIAGYDVQTA
jgi:hypothetical protein